jgi:hypothetical protein
MKKANNTYITNLFNKILSESLEERADTILSQIKEMGDIDELMNKPVETNEDEMCEQCDPDTIDEQEFSDEEIETETEEQNEDSCAYHMETFGAEDERTKRFCSAALMESLKGKQKNLDKNKNKKIDTEDFRMMRDEKKNKKKVSPKFGLESVEMEEGNAFSGARAKAVKDGKETFTVDGKTYPVKGETKEGRDKFNGRPSKVVGVYSDIKKQRMEEDKKDKSNQKGKVVFKESELITFIEKIIKEQKKDNNITKGRSNGLDKYTSVHNQSGKENEDYLKDVTKKMKEYLKDGSMGEFEMNPKNFPKNNGELKKMSKKAYVPSSAVQDYVDAFSSAGQENLDYDEIKPNDEWLDKNIEGSSETGNNPDWANAVDTGVNQKRNKIRKDNLLAKAKRKAYNKAPQPAVIDKPGEDEGDKVLNQLESVKPTNSKKLNEEFDKMKKLIEYNIKTQ